VQLDRTRIVVRERGVFDILDLALQVCRLHLKPLAIMLLIGGLPWAVLNYLLIAWMLPGDFDWSSPDATATYVRFAWTTTILVTVEAPLATAFVTAYLGHALFLERPTYRQIVREVLSMMGRLSWCHLVLRGILPTLLLVVSIDRNTGYSGPEAWLMLLLIAVLLRRATAPYINELVLLERNPIRSSNPQTITVGRRSAMLHGPASGSLLVTATTVGLYSIALTLGISLALYMVQVVLFDDGHLHRAMAFFGWPCAMWVTAGFAAVVRFLNYLDLRIRYEGWEVELRMRAEGGRLLEGWR
jgi:hypothetical protein